MLDLVKVFISHPAISFASDVDSSKVKKYKIWVVIRLVFKRLVDKDFLTIWIRVNVVLEIRKVQAAGSGDIPKFLPVVKKSTA